MRFLILIVFTGLVALSCQKDDEMPSDDLSGTIDGISFSVGSAVFEELSNGKLRFRIYSEDASSSERCNLQASEVYVSFTSPNTTDRQDLFLENMNFEGLTVSLVNPANSSNVSATEGYIKLNSIDGSVIEAEIEADAGNANNVEGRFTATRCP